MNRRLTLKAEQLVDLTPADLAAVEGGQGSQTCPSLNRTLNAPCESVQYCIAATPLCPTILCASPACPA